MRTLLLTIWLLVPVAVGAWHYGPGQEKMLLDDVARVLAQADKHAANEEWAEAEAKYEEALRLLPPAKKAESRRVRLERAKAQMQAHKLPAAHEDLKGLVEELKEDPNAEAQVLAEARTALAGSQYYMTWLMRLEGQPREVWEPEIEAARQTYRLLAEQSAAKGNSGNAKKNQKDLKTEDRV